VYTTTTTYNTSRSTTTTFATSKATTTTFNTSKATTTTYTTSIVTSRTTTFNTSRATGTSKSTTTAYATTTVFNTSASTTTVFSTTAALTQVGWNSTATSYFNACDGFICCNLWIDNPTNATDGIPTVNSSTAYTNSSGTATAGNGLYSYQDLSGSFGATHFITVNSSGLITALNSCDGGFSDRRLKKDIKLIGVSPSGLNIYSFRFKNDVYQGLWQGVMADEIMHLGPNAVSEWEGYHFVNYGKKHGVDVEFKQIGE